MANNPKSIAVIDYIKTEANLQTLVGGGTLTRDSDTLTADESRIYLVDDDSVSFNAQTLNSSQQAQARTNIGAESTTNKVTSLSSSSTDTQYPSAKCVYDIVGNIESLLGAI